MPGTPALGHGGVCVGGGGCELHRHGVHAGRWGEGPGGLVIMAAHICGQTTSEVCLNVYVKASFYSLLKCMHGISFVPPHFC